MRILLDTHLILELLRPGTQRYERLKLLMGREGVYAFASVASLWEVAIKVRLGKLDPGLPVAAIPDFLAAMEIAMLAIDVRHVIAAVDPLPVTRDPFDRLLLGVCQTDGLRLATVDRALIDHPLALEERF